MKTKTYLHLNKPQIHRNLVVFGVLLLLLGACCKKPELPYGHVRFVFEHRWDEAVLCTDETTQYINAAGNVVTFSNLEYFISNLTITGNKQVAFCNPDIHGSPNIHYISNTTAHSTITSPHRIPAGEYNHIKFIFGIDSAQNKTNFGHSHAPISPYREMFWPQNLGGGYHHMKLDGKWRHPGQETDRPFALHLGILRRTSQTAGEEVFLNYFPVVIPREFQIKRNDTTTVTIIMDVKQWLEPPYYVWDFSVMSSGIMQREHAMDSLAKNGRNVFR